MKRNFKKDIAKLISDFYKFDHRQGKFVPGKTKIKYAGIVYNEKEIINLTQAAMDFWLTAGRFADKLEARFKSYFGSRDFFLVNSGSSANLVLLSTLCSPHLKNHLRSGDEVITPAVTFPTTLTPILQNNLIPVFVDVEIGTYNINPALIEKAISRKTRAIFIPHTLGNPCDMDGIMAVAKKHNLFILEDSCDALGARFAGKLVGTFADMASLSFYPAHHMTMGEGGGVVVNNQAMARIALSLRDWGRDCWCRTGENNTCRKRFNWKLGNLPFGYDHKYIYSNIGYNLKITDMQAAVGLAQFEKLDSFIATRNKNFEYYYRNFKKFEDYLILPRVHRKAEPSWFGFPIAVKRGVERLKLIRWLGEAKIDTRLVFAGNVIRQPAFKNIKCRIAGSLKESDRVMNDTFFIGVYPGLTADMREFVVKRFNDFFKKQNYLR